MRQSWFIRSSTNVFRDFPFVVGREKGREEAAHSFASGDMVRVAEGELINLKGKVLSIDGNTILILPKHEDLKVR